jgi:hypothetical protein
MVIEKASAMRLRSPQRQRSWAGRKDQVVAGKALNVFRKRVKANKRRLSRR